LQCFSQSFMVVADSFFGATAEGQWKVQIGLLSIMIGTDCVHPQYNFFIFFVLKSIWKQIIRTLRMKKAGLNTSRNLTPLTMWLCSSPPTKTESNRRHNTNRFEEIMVALYPTTNSSNNITFS
jgi:hypothetical protein